MKQNFIRTFFCVREGSGGNENGRVRFAEIATQTVTLTNLLTNLNSSLTNCNNIGSPCCDNNSLATPIGTPASTNPNNNNRGVTVRIASPPATIIGGVCSVPANAGGNHNLNACPSGGPPSIGWIPSQTVSDTAAPASTLPTTTTTSSSTAPIVTGGNSNNVITNATDAGAPHRHPPRPQPNDDDGVRSSNVADTMNGTAAQNDDVAL